MRLAILMSVESPWSREAARQLSSLGHEVHVLDFIRPDLGSYMERGLHGKEIKALRDAVADLHFIPCGSRGNWKHLQAVPKVRAACKQNHIDMLLTLYAGGRALTAYLSGFRPYATFAVGDDVLSMGALNRFTTRRSFRAAVLVFANGAYLADKAAALAPGSRIEPLLLGIDTDRFVPGAGHDGPVRLVCSRGFLPVYNNEFLVRGLAAIPETVPDFTMNFLSSGPLLPQVKALAGEILSAPMNERVRFLGGVSGETLLDSLQESDIFVSVAKSDGTATSMLEAMACGLFPVLSDIPQNREWVDPATGNGLLVPLNDPAALADALVRAMSDRALRQRAAAINRAAVVERASSKRNMTRLAERLESVVRARGKRG